MNIKNKKTQNKKYILLLLGLVLLCLAIGVYVIFRHNTTKTSTVVPSVRSTSKTYSPPTKEEQQAGNDQKTKDVTDTTATTPAKVANVIISNLSQSGDTIRVRAFVANAVESGGNCSTMLVNGATTVSKQTVAFADASSTQCGAIDFTREQFATAGTWQVTVTYSSSQLSGSASGPITIN